MKNVTIAKMIANSNIDARVIRGVIRQFGGFDSFKESARDIARYGAASGWAGFTYHRDTVPFGKRHKAALLDRCKEFAQDCYGADATVFQVIAGFGCVSLTAEEVAEAIYNPRSDNQTEVFNALAWYALEEVARLYDDLSEENGN